MTGNIKDRFEVKGRAALEYGAEGVVVIFEHDPGAAPPAAGDPVLLVRDDGWMYSGKAEDVRVEPSAKASGLFLRGLHVNDVPLGSVIRWGSEIQIVQNAVA
jgi:hypothetical protein